MECVLIEGGSYLEFVFTGGGSCIECISTLWWFSWGWFLYRMDIYVYTIKDQFVCVVGLL